MDDDLIKEQINALIRDEIQEGINDYLEQKEVQEKKEEETGLGFAQRTVARDGEEEELKVNISQSEVDRLLKEYKKIKKRQKKSNLHQVKLLDKHGKPL
tara:strand:- start:403 stop:699 length:297 start_codon:yes stop_codon:yes gene_type:complete